jgi:hypothetical protein
MHFLAVTWIGCKHIEWNTTWNLGLPGLAWHNWKLRRGAPADSLPMTSVTFCLDSMALRRELLACTKKPRSEFLGTAMVICSGEVRESKAEC